MRLAASLPAAVPTGPSAPVRVWRRAPASFRIGATILLAHLVLAVTGPLWAPYAQAELAAGPHATGDDVERSRRQDRLQWAASMWEPLPLDAEAARAYGRVFAATRAAGRTSRTRLADLLIAATAAAHGLPLYTRNPDDFTGLDGIVHVVGV